MSRLIWVFFLFFFLFLPGGARSAELLKIFPEKGAKLFTSQPQIKIVFSQPIKKEDLQIFLNQEEITPLCLLLGNSLLYQPSSPLPGGENFLEIKFSGRKKSFKSSFFITVPRLINTLSYEDKSTYIEGEEVRITIKGIAGGKAFFSVGRVSGEIPMKETSPGVYQGSYKVALGDYQLNAPLTVRLISPSGEEEHLVSDRLLNIFGSFFYVEILSPKEGEQVSNYFDIKGKTRPLCDIKIAPSVSYPGLDTGSSNLQKLNVITTKANEKGFFNVHFGFPLHIPGLRLKFNIRATDPEGRKSLPTRFEVKVK